MLQIMIRFVAAALLCAAGSVNAQVVISQVYAGGGDSFAFYRSDFVELHNNGNTTVDLTGWSVEYSSSTGTTWSRSVASTSAVLRKSASWAASCAR